MKLYKIYLRRDDFFDIIFIMADGPITIQQEVYRRFENANIIKVVEL